MQRMGVLLEVLHEARLHVTEPRRIENLVPDSEIGTLRPDEFEIAWQRIKDRWANEWRTRTEKQGQEGSSSSW
jgi:hypothetical protein